MNNDLTVTVFYGLECSVDEIKENDIIHCYKVIRKRTYNTFPATTTYKTQEIIGKVIKIRDTEEDKLTYKTVMKNPEIERSRYLISIKTATGIIKSYDGALILTKILERQIKLDDIIIELEN